MSVASRRTVISGQVTDQAIANGNSIRVDGVVISGTAASTALLERSGTTTEELTLRVAANATYEHTIPWIADFGLQITTTGDGDTRVTILHSQEGA